MVALPPFARRECLAHPYLPAFLQPTPTPTHTPTHTSHSSALGLARRQQWFVPAPAASFAVIPQTYTPLRSHLSPGVIVAIVLGSLLGFVLLLALLWLLLGACACCGLRNRRRRRSGGDRRAGEKIAMRERFGSRTSSGGSYSYRSRSALGESLAAARAARKRNAAGGGGGGGVRVTPRGFVRKTERVVSRRAREPEHARRGYNEYEQRRGGGGGGRRGGEVLDEVVVVEEEDEERGGRRARGHAGSRRARGAVPRQEMDEVVVIEETSPPGKGSRRKQTGRRGHYREREREREVRSEVTSATSQTGSR